MRTIFDGSPVGRSTSFGTGSLSEPVVNIQSLDAFEVSLDVGHQTIPFDDCGPGNQNVGIADQLTSLVEVGIDFRRLHDDGVGEGQDGIRGTKTVKRRLLLRRTPGFETTQNLVARDDREREAMVATEIVPRPGGHYGIAPQDGR
jgi:hypothetical protein